MQITLIGSDGREYTFLAKPKDDLRKDQRMMEVAGVMNRLFAREPASRRRNLYLRRCAFPSCGQPCIHLLRQAEASHACSRPSSHEQWSMKRTGPK